MTDLQYPFDPTDPTGLPAADAAIVDLLRRAMHDETPPAAVRARAIALDDLTSRLAKHAATLLKRLVAVAVAHDPASGFAPEFGLRGAAAAGRQWLFKAEECEIDLRLGGDDHGWTLTGQLFGAASARRVVLSAADEAARIAELGPTTEFRFADLRAGRYALTVQAPEVEIVVPGIDVGPDGDD